MNASATPQPVRESGTGGSDQPIYKLQIEQTLYVALCGGIDGLVGGGGRVHACTVGRSEPLAASGKDPTVRSALESLNAIKANKK